LSSVVSGTVVIVANGSYGKRMTQMCTAHGIPFVLLEYAEDAYPSVEDVKAALAADTTGEITHVAMVHSETTSGIINDVETMGAVVKGAGRSFIVDAMSSFGAVPLDFEHVDYMVTSANKCLEGIPGFSFAIARKSALAASTRSASTLSLDMKAQLKGLDGDGQFRFTPPTHAILAFRQALSEYADEGGLPGRANRYKENQRVLQEGMNALGFELYLPVEMQGYIISSYRYPTDANWNFERFYTLLSDKGFAIYPGKVSNADCFRIGHIGRIFPEDTQRLVVAMDEACREMGTAKYAN
jgi:2-aminoethylphosphonate-pyruvate transaminase